MGRKSREKRERRERGIGPVARVAHGRSRESLLALLEAASVSPNASQYLPSLSVIYESLARRAQLGTQDADPALLHSLIKAAHEECPSLAVEEDFMPHDPRFDVRVEWAGEMFKMIAGTLERPTSNVETLRRLAATVDPVLREHAGYGVEDLVELILRRVDAVACRLASTWHSDVEQNLGSPPDLRPEELIAAAKLPPIEDQIEQCSNPQRALSALQAHSVPAKSLRRVANSPVATFSSTIAIRHGQRGFTPLPAGLMVEALNALAGELATKSAELAPSLDESWRQAAWQFVGNMFVGAGYDVIGPLRDEERANVHSVVRYNDGQHLAVAVAAGLDHMALQETIGVAVRGLEKLEPGSVVRAVRGVETIPDSTRLVRLVIVAQPQASVVLSPPRSTCAIMTLQDLDWIRRTIGREEIDLWYFVRDLVEQPRVRQLLSWDVIDTWETWRDQGKSLYRGARDLHVLFVQPHHSIIEWKAMSEQRQTERALHLLGMGRVSEWPLHSFDGTTTVIGNTILGVLYRIVVCANPAAVSLIAGSGTEPVPDLARGLGECIAHKLECAADEFASLMQSSRLPSLRVEFAFSDGPQSKTLRVTSFDGGVLTVGCAPNLHERLYEDSQSVESELGLVLAQAISTGPEVGQFVAAWNNSPPGIRLDAISVGPRIRNTPEATALHEAHRSRHTADLGAHLEEVGVAAGSYIGNDAKRIETNVVYPWLIAKLHEQLSSFDKSIVLGGALTQLEFTNCHRWWEIEMTAFDVGTPSAVHDRMPESNQALSRQSRYISLLIEEVLARPPTGTRTPTEYEWQELLNLSTLASESCFRSEALHLELTDYALIVSKVHEVTISESDLSATIDFESFDRDRSSAALPDPVPVGSRVEQSEPNEEWTPIGVHLPEYAAIEESLQESLGWGIDAIMGVLDAVIHWPVSVPRCTDFVAPERIAAEAHTANPAISLGSYAAAVEWLSLGPDDFDSEDPTIEHWEIEPRSARIATRPLAREESGVWVSPWTAQIAKRIWINYLREHRVPRPDRELPQPVVRAFERARQARQRKFEKECASILDDLPMLKIVGVRKERAHTHGIQNLSGEIDLLCIAPSRSAIFVVEAKDPFVPLSARSISGQIADFHETGGYVDTLAKKVGEIRESSVSLATTKKVHEPDRDWQVFGIMVTRHVTPSAYLSSCQMTFCTVDTLRETVRGFGV